MQYLYIYDFEPITSIFGSFLFISRDILDLASVNYEKFVFFDKIVIRHNYGKHLVENTPKNNYKGFRNFSKIKNYKSALEANHLMHV